MKYIKEIFDFFDTNDDKFVKKLTKYIKNNPDSIRYLKKDLFKFKSNSLKVKSDYIIFNNKKIRSKYLKNLKEFLDKKNGFTF